MNESTELKSVLKWIGVAVIAAIPIYVILRKIARDPERVLADSDIFSEELQG